MLTVGTPALAHDYLLMLRGAERTFAEMAACWPAAPIYTLIYDEQGTRGAFRDRHVVTSPLQRLGATQERFRHLLPLFPPATSTPASAGASVPRVELERVRPRHPRHERRAARLLLPLAVSLRVA